MYPAPLRPLRWPGGEWVLVRLTNLGHRSERFVGFAPDYRATRIECFFVFMFQRLTLMLAATRLVLGASEALLAGGASLWNIPLQRPGRWTRVSVPNRMVPTFSPFATPNRTSGVDPLT